MTHFIIHESKFTISMKCYILLLLLRINDDVINCSDDQSEVGNGLYHDLSSLKHCGPIKENFISTELIKQKYSLTC